MKALVFVLNQADLLGRLLQEFNEAGIKGCTILDSNGMGRELAKREDMSVTFGTVRSLLKPEFKNTKTLLLILDEDKIQGVVGSIEKVVGSLDNPGTGILFTFGLDFVKGLKL